MFPKFNCDGNVVTNIGILALKKTAALKHSRVHLTNLDECSFILASDKLLKTLLHRRKMWIFKTDLEKMCAFGFVYVFKFGN